MKLSLLAAILSILATLPQVYSTLKTGLLRDHQINTLFFSFVANILLLIHGYQTRDVGIILIGAWFAMYNGLLLYYKLL